MMVVLRGSTSMDYLQENGRRTLQAFQISLTVLFTLVIYNWPKNNRRFNRMVGQEPSDLYPVLTMNFAALAFLFLRYEAFMHS